MLPIEQTEDGHERLGLSHSLIGWYIIEMSRNLQKH